jgi:hypothetical protein
MLLALRMAQRIVAHKLLSASFGWPLDECSALGQGGAGAVSEVGRVADPNATARAIVSHSRSPAG